MKGFRTLLVNAGFVAAAAGLEYLASVDWSQIISPTGAVLILAGVNAALRLVTTTPVGKAD